MTYNLVITDRAELELSKALKIYRKDSRIYANRFVAFYEEALGYILNDPLNFRIIQGNLRQLKIYKYPYVVVYQILNNTVYITSIFHTSQNPTKKPLSQ